MLEIINYNTAPILQLRNATYPFAVTNISNVATLRTTEPVYDGQVIQLLGISSAGVGSGNFRYDASDTTTADDNSVTIVTSGGKRWKRIVLDESLNISPLDTLPASFVIASNDLVAVYDVSTAILRQATAEELSNFAVQNGVFTPTGAATLRTLADRFQYFNNIMDFGGQAGSLVDNTQAMHDALAVTGKVFIPPLSFGMGDVLLPDGASIMGVNGRLYNEVANPNASMLVGLIGANTVLDPSGCRGGVLDNVALDGADKSMHGFSPLTDDANQFTITRVSTTRCDVGFGGNNLIRSTSFLQTISGNGNTGYADMVDGFFNNIIANANSNNGISLTTGESSHVVMNSRLEFNGEHGLNQFGASRVQVSNTLFDRNFEAGLSCSGALNSNYSNNIFARNGKNNTLTGERSQILFGGACDNLTFTGNVARIGQEDGGTGAITPDYGIEWAAGHTCTNITMTGNNFEGGYNVAAWTGTPPTDKVIIRNNSGLPDLVIGQDINCSDGQVYQSKKSASSIASAGTAVLNMTNQPATGTLGESRELTVIVRRADTGAKFGASFKGVLDAEFGTNALRLGSAFSEIGATGSITTGGGGGTICDLVTSNFSTDGSTFDITVTNNYGSSAINVEVILK